MHVHSRLLRTVTAFAAVAALAAAGCGSDDSGGSTSAGTTAASGDGGGSGGSGIVAEAKAAVEQAQARVTGGVPRESPPVARDKFLVLIPCAQAGEGCAQPAQGAAEAAKAIGWRTQTIDGKGTADAQNAAIQQAITLKPDAIITFAIDPTSVQGAVNAARKAGIPVIGSSAVESDLLAFSDNPTKANWEQTGTAVADYLIAETDGKAKVLFFTDNEFAAVNQRTEAFRKRMEECEDCEILKEANFNFADLGSGVPSLAQQTAQANPDFDAVYVPYDAAVPSILQGLKAIGRTDKLVVAGDGTSDGIKCIREECGLSATMAFPLAWIGWADVDAANRIFNRTDPKAATAEMPVKMIVKDNAPDTALWDGDVDFRAAYEQLWKVG